MNSSNELIPGKQPMPARSVRLRLLVTADSWQARYCPQGDTEFRTAAAANFRRRPTTR